MNIRFFASNFSDCNFSLRTMLDSLEKTIQELNNHLPSEITHNLSLKTFNSWKASQGMTWLHVFAPSNRHSIVFNCLVCFQFIMDPVILNHFLLLVNSIQTLASL